MEPQSVEVPSRSVDRLRLLSRTRSTQRLRFEEETQAIFRTHGGLEEIRKRLGMTRRQLCRELLVDPSCWSRWTKQDSPPPHIVKMLVLLLEQKVSLENEQSTGTQSFSDKGSDGSVADASVWQGLESRFELLNLRMGQMEEAVRRREELTLGWKFLVIVNTLLIVFLFLS